MLTGPARHAEIERMQNLALRHLTPIFVKLAHNLSYIEVFALMIASIETRAGMSADAIKARAADITATHTTIPRIEGHNDRGDA